MDRRLTFATDRVAHESLRGSVEAPRYVAGEPMQVAAPLVDLMREPGGARDRQLLMGDEVLVIDRKAGHAFGRVAKDGYCGYIPEAALSAVQPPTHRVIAPSTHVYPEPRVQAREIVSLSLGSAVTVVREAPAFLETTIGFIPAGHLGPLDRPFSDPVQVARMFLGTPYLWGGNSRWGIDCSGLVQASLLACGIACPGDSDLQQSLGSAVSEDDLRRGDLLFWKGHVAMIVDDKHMIHATGHVMQTVIEETEGAMARIAAAGTHVLARRRPART